MAACATQPPYLQPTVVERSIEKDASCGLDQGNLPNDSALTAGNSIFVTTYPAQMIYFLSSISVQRPTEAATDNRQLFDLEKNELK